MIAYYIDKAISSTKPEMIRAVSVTDNSFLVALQKLIRDQVNNPGVFTRVTEGLISTTQKFISRLQPIQLIETSKTALQRGKDAVGDQFGGPTEARPVEASRLANLCVLQQQLLAVAEVILHTEMFQYTPSFTPSGQPIKITGYPTSPPALPDGEDAHSIYDAMITAQSNPDHDMVAYCVELPENPENVTRLMNLIVHERRCIGISPFHPVPWMTNAKEKMRTLLHRSPANVEEDDLLPDDDDIARVHVSEEMLDHAQFKSDAEALIIESTNSLLEIAIAMQGLPYPGETTAFTCEKALAVEFDKIDAYEKAIASVDRNVIKTRRSVLRKLVTTEVKDEYDGRYKKYDALLAELKQCVSSYRSVIIFNEYKGRCCGQERSTAHVRVLKYAARFHTFLKSHSHSRPISSTQTTFLRTFFEGGSASVRARVLHVAHVDGRDTIELVAASDDRGKNVIDALTLLRHLEYTEFTEFDVVTCLPVVVYLLNDKDTENAYFHADTLVHVKLINRT